MNDETTLNSQGGLSLKRSKLNNLQLALREPQSCKAILDIDRAIVMKGGKNNEKEARWIIN